MFFLLPFVLIPVATLPIASDSAGFPPLSLAFNFAEKTFLSFVSIFVSIIVIGSESAQG
ncbi:hypothetical protein HanIR_Chr03g0101781 [Helianthus annuus]|nr:hypothetical protein HanIR_Chr03g0101781 [Helianthus annuus]